ncbi:DUF1754-domain-containing protein [Coprinellus micaceus]|uniref:DUF1754-domain-containing protein n=1 Tax=Coprinellus micaceus TaxID=71717 RepID=A0A4Y7TY38_COPMI|nr:DUF1754-domain-containing protein [Coprinellus micaceus]
MSAYDFRPGGSLKLKGGVAEGGIVKKKKKKKSKSSSSKSNSTEKQLDPEQVKEILKSDELVQASSGSGPEKRFEEVQRKRLEQRVHKLAKKTHKDRVADFNNHLETLSEHHDIPKVSKHPTALLQPNLTASFRLVPDKIQPGCCLSSLSRFSWSFCMLSTCTATKQAPSTIYHWVRRELRSGHSSVQLLQRNTWLERVNYVPE